MTYQLTFQSALHERPVVQSFDTKEEAEEAIREVREWVEEQRVPWKLEPTLRVEQ